MTREISSNKKFALAALSAALLTTTAAHGTVPTVASPERLTLAAEQTMTADQSLQQAFDALIAEAKQQMMTDPVAAIETASNAEQIVRTVDDFENREISLATTLWLKGEAFLRSGQPEEGQPVIASALEILGDRDSTPKLRADLLLAQGRIAGRATQMELAVRSYIQAHEIFVQLGESRNEAISLMALGSINRDAEDYLKALNYYERAAEVYSGDDRVDLSSANNRANILKELGRHDEARGLFQDALNISIKMGSDVLQGRILTNLADNEILAGNLMQAEEFAQRARTAFGDNDGTDWLRYVSGTQAHIRLLENDVQAAKSFITDAFDGVDMETTSLSFEEMHEVAYQVYSKLGAYEKALQHHERLKSLTDEATKAAASANVALLDAQFNFSEQKLNIERLKTTQLETDLELKHAEERTLMYLGFATVAGLLVLFCFVLAVGYRRHRDQVSLVNAALKDSVKQRDIEIQQRRTIEKDLVIAKELAEKANEAKSTFLATMSHELRTPMNGILGFADVLKGSGLNDDQQGYLDIITNSGESLLTLINDILDISQIEAGKLKISNRLFQLNDTIEEAVMLLKAKASEKNLNLAMHIDPDLPTHVNGDPDRLRQILINLVGNAIKFTEKGSVAVVVNYDEATNNAKFSVLDSGIGIPKDKIDVLFERFSQVDSSSTRNYGGTGLGLAICRELVQCMDGSINVSSEEGVGSNFWFDLPLEPAEEAERLPRRRDRQFTERKRVLIVDPIDINRRVYQLIMEPMNVDATFAKSSTLALDIVKSSQTSEEKFDYIIISDTLQECTATALNDDIRANETYANVKTVLSSPQFHSPTEFKNAGFDGYIGQPISDKTVCESFHKLLLTQTSDKGEASPSPVAISW